MNFYDRYVTGEDGRYVYSDIYNLRQEAFNDKYIDDIKSVLTETLNRVAFNLDIIFSELKNINYAFKTEFQTNSDKPLSAPLPNTADLLHKLDNETKSFGQIPYSLKLFYQIVGSCNFAWDYENQPAMIWQCADPIQINSLDDIVNYVSDDDWKEYLGDTLFGISCRLSA